MLIISAASFFVSKIFKFGKTEQQFVSKMLLFFVNPSLIISHFDMDFDEQKLKAFGIVALLSVAAHFVMLFTALVFARSKKAEDKSLDCIDKLSVIFTNCGFIGIPLIHGVLGSEGVFYLLSYIAVFNIFMWTFGYYLMAGTINLKKIVVNPNILSVILGLILFCLPVKFPETVSKPIKIIGNMNTPFAMILIGMLFATFNWKSAKIYAKRLVKVLLLRHVVVAILMFAIIFAATKLLAFIPDFRTMGYVIYIASLCPSATGISGLSVLFGKDESYAAFICMATSVFCIMGLPLAVGLAELVF